MMKFKDFIPAQSIENLRDIYPHSKIYYDGKNIFLSSMDDIIWSKVTDKSFDSCTPNKIISREDVPENVDNIKDIIPLEAEDIYPMVLIIDEYSIIYDLFTNYYLVPVRIMENYYSFGWAHTLNDALKAIKESE